MTRVLLIDQDQKFCRLLGEHLVREGMTLQFAHDGRSGLISALTGEHDLVVLCETLPELTGLQVTRQLRNQSDIGVLMLSGDGEEVDRIVALECGADDYLDKPFSPRELIARIRAISRRVRTASKARPVPEFLEIGDVMLDEGSRKCCRNGQIIDLTTAEFALLKALLRSSGRVIHRRELSRMVLDREHSPLDRSIDVHVSKLRRKLGVLPDGTERIRSVRNIGYLYAHSTAIQMGRFMHRETVDPAAMISAGSLARNMASISGDIVAADAKAQSKIYSQFSADQKQKLEQLPHPVFGVSAPLLPPGPVFMSGPGKSGQD